MVLDHFQSLIFEYLEKNGVLKFFERLRNPEPVIHGYTKALLNFAAFLFWTLLYVVLFMVSAPQNKILQFHFFH